MKRSFLMSTAAAALIACGGYAFAQTGGGSQAPGGSSQAPQASPSQSGGSMSQGAPGSDTKGGADMKKMPSGSAETKGEMKGEGKSSGAAEMKGDTKQGASETGKSDRTGTAEQQKDRAQKSGQSTEQQKQSTEQPKQSTEQQKTGTDGAASANLSTDQQTRIRTVIKERSDVKAVTNVNFNISIRAPVPRTVTLYPLPPAVVEVHPAWRGYRFILVRDEIVVVDPGTMLIVAVIPA
jgi:hypothetical protein